MSKSNLDVNEMHPISMSASHPMNEETAPLMPNPSNGNASSNQFPVPPRRNSPKVSYLNEKEMNPDRNNFQGQKSDPAFFPGKGQYKESSIAYQPFYVRMPDYTKVDPMPSNNKNSRLINGKRAVAKGVSPNRVMDRSTQYHTFLADAADVRQIEDGLLKLMEEFQTGNLRAFGKDSRLHQMEEIREQQEKLAKLHFDIGAEQDSYPPLCEDGLRVSDQNMKTLMEKLADLSESIENLHTNSTERKTSTNERKTSSLEKRNGQNGLVNGVSHSDQRSSAFPFMNGEKEHARPSNIKVEAHTVRQEAAFHESGAEHAETVLLRRS